ncbi:MAG: tetratricopeptide repeat protein [Elusimicrobiales bacterium]
MKKRFLKITLILILSYISVLLTSELIIDWVKEKGLFFTAIIFMKKIDFNLIPYESVIGIMPLSNAVYSIFSIIELKYILLYVFLIYLLSYSALLSSAEKINSSWGLIFFSLLLLFNIYTFRECSDVEQIIYSVYLTSSLFFFYLKEQTNSTKNNILFASVFGSSFLIRSPLIILPPIFFIYEIMTKKDIKNALILLITPYLWLIPWAFFSLSISGTPYFTEMGRAKLNILTSLAALTHTAEENTHILKQIILDSNTDINTYIFLKLQLKAFLNRFIFFLKIFHIIALLPFIVAIIKRNKIALKMIGIVYLFVFIHILSSVEKRYFFPLGFMFSFILTYLFFPKKEITEKTPSVFTSLILPPIIVSLMIMTYPFFSSKKILSHPVLYLVDCLEKLNASDYKNAIKDMKEYVSKQDYLHTSHIKNIIDIAEGNIKKKEKNILFNIDFVIFLKLIDINQEQLAFEYLKNNWYEISSSYLRDPSNEREKRINKELSLRIKENSMTYPSFVIAGRDIENMERICIKANDIIKKTGKKHQFDCSFDITSAQDYIKRKCLSSRYTDEVASKVFEIVEFEKNKDFEKAIKLSEAMIEKTDIYKFYVEKANILYLMKRYHEANENYSKAIERCPCAADALYGKINIPGEKEETCKLIKRIEVEKRCPSIANDIKRICK